MHQERRFPGRPIATSLANPDFVELFGAFGIPGRRIHADDEVESALAALRGAGTAAVLEICTDPAQALPDERIEAMGNGVRAT
jgi:acetolactate synthase-1/2/3 large subunit